MANRSFCSAQDGAIMRLDTCCAFVRPMVSPRPPSPALVSPDKSVTTLTSEKGSFRQSLPVQRSANGQRGIGLGADELEGAAF